MGFRIEDKQLRRAGLDYHEWASIKEYKNFPEFQGSNPNRCFACSTKGKQLYTELNYQDNDMFLFGPESCGLPTSIRENIGEPHTINIPMVTTTRSLNLANAASIILYEAWRQLNFEGSQV